MKVVLRRCKQRLALGGVLLVTLLCSAVWLAINSKIRKLHRIELDYDRGDFVGTTSEKLEEGHNNHNITLCCHLLTIPRNHKTKLPAVLSTWLHRCDHFFVVSDALEPEVENITVLVPEEILHHATKLKARQLLWTKSRFALRRVWQMFGDKCHWFMKADDDSFIIIERLKSLLADYDYNQDYWAGYRYIKKFGIYMAGGSGYTISRHAMKRLVEEGFDNESICRQKPDSTEDINIGKCMANLNVSSIDTRDAQGRHRFFPLSVVDMMLFRTKWFGNWSLEHTVGRNCCSSNPIGFHYVNVDMMRLLEYLTYHVKSLF